MTLNAGLSYSRAAGRCYSEPMLLSITHTTEYTYPKPAWDSFNELRLQPADDYRQTVLQFELEVVPATALRNHLDYYGNTAHHFHLSTRHDTLRITSSALVSTYPIPAPHTVPAGGAAGLAPPLFRVPSAHCAASRSTKTGWSASARPP